MRKLIAIMASCTIGAAALGFGYQTWKGMVYTQPGRRTLSVEQQVLGLNDFSTVSVVVEELPEAFKDSMTDRDLQTWTENRLQNMGLEVISNEKQGTVFINKSKQRDKLSEAQLLRIGDEFRSGVYVNLAGLRDSSGTTHFSLTLRCKRGVLIHPGHFSTASIWDKGVIGYYGSAIDGKANVRQGLNRLLDRLETDWKTCNPK